MCLTFVSLSFETKAKLLWEFGFMLEGQMHSEQSSKTAKFSGHNMKSEREKQSCYGRVIVKAAIGEDNLHSCYLTYQTGFPSCSGL